MKEMAQGAIMLAAYAAFALTAAAIALAVALEVWR
jgi:hypothetical protein